MIAGKKPSMFEKWWGPTQGVGLNCLFVREASSRAISSPARVTARALSFNVGCIVITGVFRGSIFEVIRRPAMMLPQARRLMGLMAAGFRSVGGRSVAKRG